MHIHDTIEFALHAMHGALTRTLLTLLAMAIGVASVVLLTSLGEGARVYVTDEFSALGTNLLIVLPGRNETTGGAPPMMGATPRDLTTEDAEALTRSAYIKSVAPLVLGSTTVSYQERQREVSVIGTTAAMFDVRELSMLRGKFLSSYEMDLSSSECVMGYKLYKELFDSAQPLGEWLRVNDYRCRVIGVLDEKGMSIGMDMSDMLIVPTGTAKSLYNVNSLFRILIKAHDKESLDRAQKFIIKTLRERHDGEEDVTVISQDSILSTFDNILSTLTYTLGGIAAVSLVVAGIMIMNVMLVAVTQRTKEIGLLKALGAPRRQIMTLFLTESAFLSLMGAVLGLAAGQLFKWALQSYFPSFPFVTPSWAIIAAVVVALVTGILFGLMPARRAAELNPVEALSGR
jgi:putative ABC transport system permease protein